MKLLKITFFVSLFLVILLGGLFFGNKFSLGQIGESSYKEIIMGDVNGDRDIFRYTSRILVDKLELASGEVPLEVAGRIRAEAFCLGNNCVNTETGWGTSGGLWSLLGGNVYRETGFVGIGISEPNRKLHIFDDRDNAEINIQSIDGEEEHWGLYVNSGDNSFRLWGQDDHLTILRDGKVGIGNNEPEHTLSVVGDIKSDSFCLNGACVSDWSTVGGSGSNWSVLDNDVYRLNGSVGIGTSSPTSKLHIFNNNSGPIISLSGSNTNYRGLATRDLNNTEKWFIGNNNSNNFVIRRNGSANDLFINSSGNIGIGTDNPATKLHVNGTIRTNLIGSNNRCLYVTSNGDIAAKSEDCGTASGGDNLGNHIATQNLTLGANYISNTGANAGLNFDISNNAIFSGSVNLGAQATNTNQAVRADRTISPGTGLSGGGNLTSNLTLSLTNTGVIAGNYGNSNNVPVITIDAQGRITSASTASITSTSNWSLSGNNVYRLNGNVGLGTSSPSTKLHLFHATSGPIISLSGIDSNYRGLAIRNLNNAERWFIGDNENSNFVIRRQEADSNDIVVNSDGNIAIGTSSPTSKLHIFDSDSGPIINLLGIDTNYRGLSVRNINGAEDWFVGTNEDNRLVIRAKDNLDFFIINDVGSTGLGTNNPQSRLHIMEEDVVFSYEDNSTLILEGHQSRIDIISQNAQGGIINFREMLYSSTGQIRTEYYLFNQAPKHRMIFSANNFYFDNSIGIGVNIPQAQLHIQRQDIVSNYFDDPTFIVEDTKARIDIISQNAQGGIINFRDALFASTGQISTEYYLDGHAPRYRMNFSADSFNFDNRVGINTNSPAAALHVNGSIRGEHQASNGQSGLTKSYLLQDANGASCQMHFVNGLLVESNCLQTSFNPNPPLR